MAHPLRLVAVLATLQAACGAVAVDATSGTFLSHDESRAVLHEDAATAARDVLRVLGERGFQLLDRRVDGNATELVFRDRGMPLASGGEVCARSGCSSDVSTVVLGSELVARLTALRDGGTGVELVGRPLIDGAQPVVEPSLAGQP